MAYMYTQKLSHSCRRLTYELIVITTQAAAYLYKVCYGSHR